MPISKKGKKKVSKGLRAYANNGERIAVHAPIGAYDAFMENPHQDRAGDKAWDAALKRLSDHEAWSDVDAAHGHAMADLSEEAFLTGFYAGAAFAKSRCAMIARAALEKSNDALTRARDLAILLMYATKRAPDNEDELRDLVASADTVLEYLVSLITDAEGPIHDAIAHDIHDQRRQLTEARVSSKVGAR